MMMQVMDEGDETMASGRKENFNFRDLTNGLVLIVNDRNLNTAKKVFESRETDNAILACGYVDHTAGVSFEVLCLGEYGPNGNIELRRGNPTTSFKLRYGSVTGIIVLLEDQMIPALQDKIDMVREGYKVSDAVMKARNSTIFDDFRHPQYPDDMLILFLKKGVQPEGIWCRVEGEEDGRPAAVLLNEPNADFGVHQGNCISFGWTEVEGEMKGIAILPDME